jgi:TrmH family RNA methyltransferase
MDVSKSQIKFVRGLQMKKNRDEEHLFVAEGLKSIVMLYAHFELVECFVDPSVIDLQSEEILTIQKHAPQRVYIATNEDISKMSSMRTPQGIIGVFRQSSYPTQSESPQGLCLVLDSIQDPGNMGTIIRTADWFGVKDIYCSPQTVDCYNPKVIQATMGSLGHVRIHYLSLPKWFAQLPPSVPIIGTLLDGKNIYTPNAFPKNETCIIIMGNEGKGISDEIKQYITHPVCIPSYALGSAPMDKPESLNVSIATGIILAKYREL